MANLMVQRLSASGVSFCGADTGGFLGRPSPELFCRWMQMAAFHVFFRNHNNGEYGGQEPWCFGPVVEGLVRRAVEERYRLLPYFYTQFYRYSTQGTPIIRSLALMYPENPDTYWRSSEFFLGEALYVVPVHHPGEGGRFLYVPPGHWYSLWNDAPAPITNAEAWVSTSMSTIPVLVRGGSVIPRWPVQQYVGELSDPQVTLDLWWAPELRQQSELYEDEGDGYGYRKGRYMLHRFDYRAQLRSFVLTHSLNIHAEQHGRTLVLAVHSLPHSAAPVAVADGVEQSAEFDERHVYRVTLPINFSEIYIKF
jgi:alpha-glucosidase